MLTYKSNTGKNYTTENKNEVIGMIWNLVAILANQFPPQNKVVQHSLKQAELTSNKPHNETEPKDLCKTT
jgi:hypothetical protein